MKRAKKIRDIVALVISCIWVILGIIVSLIDARALGIVFICYFVVGATILSVFGEPIDSCEYEIDVKIIEKIKKCIGKLYTICMFRTDTDDIIKFIDTKTIEDIVSKMTPFLNFILVGSDCNTFKMELHTFLNDNLNCINGMFDIDNSKLSNLIYEDIVKSTHFDSNPIIGEEGFWNEMCRIYRDKKFITDFIYYNSFLYDTHITNKLIEYYNIRTLDEEKRLLGRRYKWLHKHLTSYFQTSKISNDNEKYDWVKNI
jgi:hypothetical protein